MNNGNGTFSGLQIVFIDPVTNELIIERLYPEKVVCFFSQLCIFFFFFAIMETLDG